MPTAELSIPATPEQARTARLVAGAAARNAGVDPEVIDDVRLAVAEAVARAIQRRPTMIDPADGVTDQPQIKVAMTSDGVNFEVAVADSFPDAPTDQAGEGDLDLDDGEWSLSLLRALAVESRLEVNAEGGQTVVLSWPVLAA